MVMKCKLENCKCCEECERGEAVDHSHYLTWYRPIVVQICDVDDDDEDEEDDDSKMFMIFSNPGWSSKVDIMEFNTGLEKSVAEVELEHREDLGETQKLLISSEKQQFTWPLHMPPDDEVIEFCPDDIIVYDPSGMCIISFKRCLI
jgi:hypothetical protein